MNNVERITSVAGLKSEISVLEDEHSAKELLLREQLYLTYESLRPVNIIKDTLRDMFSPNLTENISGTAIGAAGGYLLRKLLVGSSRNLFRKLLGSVLQLGITNVAANKSEAITSFGQYLLQKLLHKKEKNTE